MNIAIVGYGLEGKASYEYWNRDGNQLTIVDERDQVNDLPLGVSTVLGGGVLGKLANFDLIVRSPSINPKKLPYGDKVWSATNEFFAKCPAPIIGVTGTKGKGTTSSLIASILRAAGKTVHLVGNIGNPALEELSKIRPEDIVVYELSSFQLWDIKKSPHIAVVLGIEPDHLDVHDSMDDYVAAKANIVKYQTTNDIIIFNRNNELSIQIATGSAANKIGYPFAINEFVDSLKLPGKHNEENASAAIAAVREYVQDDESIRAGLATFEGLPHRLKFVREVNGIKFYDDSIATTPGSAIAAINSFSEPKIIILGGSDKGADYAELIKLCERTNTKVIAVGQLGAEITELCSQLGVICELAQGTMQKIVSTAYEVARSGEIVILSPAAASYDMFDSYADRGDQFIEAVTTL